MNIIDCKSKEEFRLWLDENSLNEKECWVKCKRGKLGDNPNVFYYIDAVYVALSFGWIDSTVRKIDGETIQRFSPRRKNSYWSWLNKERCKWLIKHDLMTSEGFNSLPDLDEEFVIDDDIIAILKEDSVVWNNFNNFHPLYQRIKIGNIQKYRNDLETFNRMLNNFISKTRDNKLYGDWNDNGRLI